VSIRALCQVAHCLLRLFVHRLGGKLGASCGPTYRAHFPAGCAAAEELIAAIGFESRHVDARRHLEAFQHFAGTRIDSPQLARVVFPGAVPEFPVAPGDAGDEAVGFDGAKNFPGLGIDLMNPPVAIASHPERSFGPRKP